MFTHDLQTRTGMCHHSRLQAYYYYYYYYYEYLPGTVGAAPQVPLEIHRRERLVRYSSVKRHRHFGCRVLGTPAIVGDGVDLRAQRGGE